MAREYTLHRHSAPAGPAIDYAAELNEQQCAAVTALLICEINPSPTG